MILIYTYRYHHHHQRQQGQQRGGEAGVKRTSFSASSVRFELSVSYVSTAKFINAHFMQSLSCQALPDCVMFRMGGWGRLLFPYELLGFPFSFLKNRIFLFFKKKRERKKKVMLILALCFLEGNGRCVGLHSFLFSLSESIPHIPPAHPTHSDMSSEPLMVCSCG